MSSDAVIETGTMRQYSLLEVLLLSQS